METKIKRKSLAQLQKQVDKFNATYAVGCAVDLTDALGNTRSVIVSAPATVLGGHSAVGWFEGVKGCYDLDRINMTS